MDHKDEILEDIVPKEKFDEEIVRCPQDKGEGVVNLDE